jgi:solute carrier family 25 carnitine/acylcarnitine transporter 20/29
MVNIYIIKACGATAGLANSVLSGPIEHVRIRLQVQSAGNKIYSGPLDFFRKVYSSYGIGGIYKGQAITLLREIHGYGVIMALTTQDLFCCIRVSNSKNNGK